MITGVAIYAAIKFWTPIIGFAGIMTKLYYAARKAINKTKEDIAMWADTLVSNHMTHIQVAAESASGSLAHIASTNSEMAMCMAQMREDFRDHQKDVADAQAEIHTALEVIKVQVG